MNAPDPQAVEQAETVVVREALGRGYITQEQLREALLLRDQLRAESRAADLLRLLGARYLRPEHRGELSQIYFQALNAASAQAIPIPAEPPARPPSDMDVLASSEDELAIPEFLLERSTMMARRPPEEDPHEVQEFLARSGEVPAPPPDAIRPPTQPEELQEPMDDEEGEGEDMKGSGLWRWIRGRISR